MGRTGGQGAAGLPEPGEAPARPQAWCREGELAPQARCGTATGPHVHAPLALRERSDRCVTARYGGVSNASGLSARALCP